MWKSPSFVSILKATTRSSMSSSFVSNMFNPSPDTSIDSIFNLNTESTSLVDVLITSIAEPPLLSCNNHSSTTHSSHHTSATNTSSYTSNCSKLLPTDLPNFGSLFGFDHRLKTLENNFSELQSEQNHCLCSILQISGIDN
ncbi:hypothetical protein Tco_0211881 [Tanacetum coccineum]